MIKPPQGLVFALIALALGCANSDEGAATSAANPGSPTQDYEMPQIGSALELFDELQQMASRGRLPSVTQIDALRDEVHRIVRAAEAPVPPAAARGGQVAVAPRPVIPATEPPDAHQIEALEHATGETHRAGPPLAEAHGSEAIRLLDELAGRLADGRAEPALVADYLERARQLIERMARGSASR